MKTLSLCMIVKNGEKYIEQCLESVFPALTEIIIADTGSDDGTLKRAERFNPRVYRFEWNNNFSDARNFALKYATGDYTIVLDADEALYGEDLPRLIQTIENTDADCVGVRFYNLIDENNENAFNIHEGLRIFKTGAYHYEGAIHEQPVFNFPGRNPVIEYSGIRIKHYGYTAANAGDEKYRRNITILEKVLEENPGEPFHQFNMGNQYMSRGDYETALSYYEKACEHMNVRLAYSPHLIYRRASCLLKLARNEECLAVIAQGLALYPACTDMEFLRGLALAVTKRYTLALDSFSSCVGMGQAPANLIFLPDTADVRPLIEMAGIYSLMEDYEKALNLYIRALGADGKRYYLIYSVADVLNKIFRDKETVREKLCGLFADSSYKPNVMVMADALLNEKLFEQARSIMEGHMANSAAAMDSDELFLNARLMFYANDYAAAYLSFGGSIRPNTAKGILPNIEARAYGYMTVCGLLNSECHSLFTEAVAAMDDSPQKSAFTAFLTKNKDPLESESLGAIVSVLTKLLSLGEYDAFEQSLDILNLADAEDVLLTLAEIYFENGYHDLAVKTILRSVKELDRINSRAVTILNRVFTL